MKSKIEIHCKYDKLVTLDELKPNPDNPNQHPDEQIELLAKIIKENGWRDRIVVSNLSGMIVKGHGRYQAAVLSGLGEVPVEYQDYASVADEVRDLIADNKIAELSAIDDRAARALIESLDDIDLGEIDLSGFGFTDDEIINLFPETAEGESPDDEIPEVGEEPVTKPGDLYLLGNHRLLCGDSGDKNLLKNFIGENEIALLIFDPSYENEKLWEIHHKFKKTLLFTDYKHINNAFKITSKYKHVYQFIWDGITSWYTPNRPLARHKSAFACMDSPGWNFDSAIYHDDKVRVAKIVSNSRGDCNYKPLPMGGVHLQTVFTFGNTRVQGDHRHSKPVSWLRALISGLIDSGNFILDVFGGSGSTIIAAGDLFPCMMVEIDGKNCDLIVKRWEKQTGKNAKLLSRDPF